MRPTITVAICTKDRQERIRKAVDSVISNSFRDFEFLIVDQSVDETTRLLLETYRDERVRYIKTETVGLARARNIAIKESLAGTIVFTDDNELYINGEKIDLNRQIQQSCG